MDDAAKYATRGEWRKRSPSAYVTAARLGILGSAIPLSPIAPKHSGAEWRPVVYGDVVKGLYEVSSMGEVRLTQKTMYRSAGDAVALCPDTKGYPIFCALRESGKRSPIKVHRLVAEAFIGGSDGLQVNHKDGDKKNNAVFNLEYVTASENVLHAVRNGLMRGGVMFRGELMPVKEAVKKFSPAGVTADRVSARIGRNGWSVEDAILTPPLPLGNRFKGAKNAER
jgi:hypothetical protein